MELLTVKVWLVLPAILFFISCSEKGRPDVVAEVGESVVTLQELKEHMQFNVFSEAPSKNSSLRISVLAGLVAEKILSQEALARNFEREKIKNFSEQFENEAIIEEFWRSEIISKISISEKEVRDAYFKSKEKRIVEYLQFDDKDKAQYYQNLINSGKSFEELAELLGYDKTKIPIDTIQFDTNLPNINKRVFALAQDECSGVVEEGKFHFIFKLKGIKKDLFTSEEDFLNSKKRLTKQLQKIKTIESFEAYQKEYLQSHKYSIDKKLLKQVTRKFDQMLFENSMSVPVKGNMDLASAYENIGLGDLYSNLPIVNFADGTQWSTEKLLNKMSVSPYPLDFKSRGGFRKSMIVVVKHLLDDEVLVKRSKKLGIDASLVVAEQAKIWQDNYQGSLSIQKLFGNQDEKDRKNNLEKYLLESVNKYPIKINKDIFESIEIQATNMMVLKTHFPTRTIVPPLIQFLNLPRWEAFISEQAQQN